MSQSILAYFFLVSRVQLSTLRIDLFLDVCSAQFELILCVVLEKFMLTGSTLEKAGPTMANISHIFRRGLFLSKLEIVVL